MEESSKTMWKAIGVLLLVGLLALACARTAPAPPTQVPAPAAPTPLPPTEIVTPAATPVPPATAVSPTEMPTAAAAVAAGLPAADVEKLIDAKFNTVDRDLALWNIQPGLGTVMIEYGNRLARLWQAAQAGNWDMAKYQLDEMIEIQETGETTRPNRADPLKAFEHGFLDPLNQAIDAQQIAGFEDGFKRAMTGCNACHAAAKSPNFKSYGFVKIQVPTADNDNYIVWKAARLTGDYVAAPEAPAPTARPPLAGPADIATVEKLVNDKFNTVDRSLALWNIQPGLGTVMIEYARRMAQLTAALSAGNWDMASYQLAEAIEIQEVGETTRPARAPMLKAFEDGYLKPLDAALTARDKTKADAALEKAIAGCNACHAASKSANFNTYGFVEVKKPSADPADYVLWNVGDAGMGNHVAPEATPASAATPEVTPASAATPEAAASASGKLPVGDATAGQAVFKQDCDACHPAGGKGIGPALSGADFSSEFASDEAVANIIRHGQEAMPAFADRLTDQQIADVIAFIRSLK